MSYGGGGALSLIVPWEGPVASTPPDEGQGGGGGEGWRRHLLVACRSRRSRLAMRVRSTVQRKFERARVLGSIVRGLGGSARADSGGEPAWRAR